ncbi:MAG: sensor histidine kinase [Chloroflexi bacterium]|nr:MAG: sensor histidine kinase [Chloroflexota bacterium]
MKRAQIEPGLLSIFRLTNAIRLALLSLALLAQITDPQESVTPLVFFGALNAAFVMVYLYIGWLRRRMGRLYLPFGIFVVSVGAIMEQWLNMVWRIDIGTPSEMVFQEEGYLFILLFVPLLIVSAQYNFKTMLAFTLGTGALQAFLGLLLVDAGGAPMNIILQDISARVFVFPIIGFLVLRLIRGQRKQRDELAASNLKLARYATTVEQLAVSHERNRMARELHDTLAHTLSAVSVQLEALNAQLDNDPTGAKQTLRKSQDLTRSGLQEVRRALQALRASPLEDLGLALAIRHLTESVAQRSGMKIDLTISSNLGDLDAEVEQSIYRITEEAFNNAIRHANAQTMTVSLLRNRDELCLIICDDGIGFDLETASQNGHYGLTGMRERALLCNGHLDVESEPGKGTTVRLTVRGN